MPSFAAGLQLVRMTLDRRRAALLQELNEVERDLQTLRRAVEIVSRIGIREQQPEALPGGGIPWQDRAPATAATPVPSVSGVGQATIAGYPPRNGIAGYPPRNGAAGVARGEASPPPFQAAERPVTDYTRVLDALETIGPARNESAIPPKIDEEKRRLELADVPRDGEALRALYESVAPISEMAQPHLEGGGRRRLSSKGLVPGEPLAPSLVAVLRAARRPLATHDCVAAALQQRGLRLSGDRLMAVVSRASSVLGEQAKKGRVKRIRREGERAVYWMIADEDDARLG